MKSTVRVLILSHALRALAHAWLIKIGKTMRKVKLPSAPGEVRLSEADLSFVIGCTDFLVKLGAKRTGRKCFFRAFIAASVLRKWGVPVTMNIGLRPLPALRKASGHCWLTLDGIPFAETGDPHREYPFAIGQGENGVRYWFGATAAST